MDRNERAENPHMALLTAMLGRQADIWTAMPGIIQSFDHVKKTCVVQVSVQIRQLSPVDGSAKWVKISPLLDCPVFFPSGGGYTMTFPLTLGDECLVVFASRCIDAWWQSGGTDTVQPLLRMHDLSDGFVFAGISSVPAVQPNISINSAQFRSNDGATFVELKSGVINITAPTQVHITAPTVTVDASSSATVTTPSATINGDTTTVNATTATINATTAAIVAGGSATVTAPSISLKSSSGGSSLKSLLNSDFATLYNSHTHSDPQGGSTGGPSSAAGSGHMTATTKSE